MQSKPDIDKKIKILTIKKWQLKGYNFFEIVALYNAEYGTKHFSEILL